MTDAAPDAMALHIEKLDQVYNQAAPESPSEATQALRSYTEAVIATAESIISNPDSPPGLKLQATNTVFQALGKQQKNQMIGTKELLEACDRIEVIGAGSEAATAATYNRTQILADALIRAGTDPAKRSETLARLIDSALKLGRAKPPHPATCEILNRLALEALAQGDRAHARELYALMGTEFPDHPIGKYGKGAAERIEAVGGELSDFRGKDLIDGRDRDLKEFRGKVVLIDFWATWCQPCREEMPKLAKLRRELQPKGFELVGFCLGQTAEEARQFVSEYGFDWPHFLDPGASGELTDSPVAIRFGVLSIPFKMVIDREGRLLAAGNTFDEIKPALDKAVESPKVSNDAPNPATPEKSEKPK